MVRRMRRGAPGIAAAVVTVLAGGAVWWYLSPFDAETVASQLRAAESLGPVALFALLVLQCVIAPIPSEPLMMAAGFVYGPTAGFTIAWLGVVLGAAVCFGLARTLGRPFALRFVRAKRLDALDRYLTSRGLGTAFAIVLGIRLFAFTSFDVVSYGCGLVRFPFRWFLLATALGVVPKAFAFAYAGATVSQRPEWLDVLILAGTFGALVAVPWLLRRRSNEHPQRSVG